MRYVIEVKEGSPRFPLEIKIREYERYVSSNNLRPEGQKNVSIVGGYPSRLVNELERTLKPDSVSNCGRTYKVEVMQKRIVEEAIKNSGMCHNIEL